MLWVDEDVHAAECRRFDASVVYGPTDADCNIWVKAIGGDGYGRFYITRNGRGSCVRPHRYALARVLRRPLSPAVFGLHGCNNPFLGGFGVLGETLQEVGFKQGTLR